MTATKRTPPRDPAPQPPPRFVEPSFRVAWLWANVWLLFLLFPLLTVIADDQSTIRTATTIILVVTFAIVHAIAFGETLRRDFGMNPSIRWLSSRGWFSVLVVINVAAFIVGGWALLAVLPFVVSYANFNFRWRTVIIVGASALLAVIVLPALGGVLDDVWFFSILVLSVGASTAMIRLNDESQGERTLLLTQLAIGEERDRMARDVHDVLGHSLTVVILKAQVCARLLGSIHDGDQQLQGDHVQAVVSHARGQLEEIESVSRSALREIRTTVGGLRAPELTDELAAARSVLADAGVQLTVYGEANQIDSSLRETLGWVVREAVTNVVRHARASHCEIHLAPAATAADEVVLLRISDDGVTTGGVNLGNGLTGLRERVEAIDASLRVTANQGVTIEVVTPSPELLH